MKALLIYRVDISDIANQGVSRKMQGHIWGFQKNQYDVDTIYLSLNGLYFNENLVKRTGSTRFAKEWFKLGGIYKSILSLIDPTEYQILLVRHHLLMPAFLTLLQEFKSTNTNLKIVIDLPTFPYKKEWKGLKGMALLKIDHIIRSRIAKYVDLILHYGKEKMLFNVACLFSTNGIIAHRYRVIEINKVKKRLNMIAVGKWQYWHGLDRLIIGISNYYRDGGSEDIVFNIVGEGPALDEYQRLALERKVENYVLFHGNIYGNKLDELFNGSTIGIGTLGLERKGVRLDSSLKHREYCARGLPFILGSDDLDFPSDLGFVRYFYGEGPIDLFKILEFIEHLPVNSEEIAKYAESLDFGVKIKIILEKLGLESGY